GLVQVAKQVVGHVGHILRGEHCHGMSTRELTNNPYWPDELAKRAGSLDHDRGLVLAPLALSRTQDDKGRVRWTLFGGSEQGPGKPFWRSFFIGPKKEAPADAGIGFFCRLLHQVYGEPAETADDLRRLGFRILPTAGQAPLPLWDDGPLPSWTEPLVLNDRRPAGAKYLLTFRPFGDLPASIRKAYLAGDLHLIPTPASLVFWGCERYLALRRQLPFAIQVPLLHTCARHHAPTGLRVPQSGYLHVPAPGHEQPHEHAGPVRNTFKRTHRWDRILRDQDELALIGREEPLLHVLFSTIPEDMDLYDKPLARNIQLWTMNGELLLDGPRATPEEIRRVFHLVESGGTFGYRFVWPAMRVGRHEVYWHRILAAFPAGDDVDVLPDAPLGYLTAYPTGGGKDRDPRSSFAVPESALEKPVELWPRLEQRPLLLAAARLATADGHKLPLARNLRKLFDAVQLTGEPLPRRLARRLISVPRETTLDGWLATLPAGELADGTRALIRPADDPPLRRKGAALPESLTYARTARRAFEVDYWKTIAALSEGRLLNKNNADCVRDASTQNLLTYHERQLDELGDFLLGYYRKLVAGSKAVAGSMPFQWRTDFDFSWMGGWEKNREGPAERDIFCVIPGKDRSRAVIMGDHYDTAYMSDRYEKEEGGRGARIAACGADDNHSATAAMMLAAPTFLALSKAGKLGCDIWLVHLTGEEFPADCLGARALTERLVEGTLRLQLDGKKQKDLSDVRVQGLYVSDMIAHNNDHDRDVFQIAPGTSRGSFWLAEQANIACETWNESAPVWNKSPERAGRPRGRRSPHGRAIPEIAPFVALDGQVRPVTEPHSTLYNTDGQIFSDAGVPVVLFMENYDINRTGYHDTHDTMANIDLDYGAALAAITIEAVARTATAEPPG
ncbi:MAG TPA: M28 family peptidase, partial [Gemmataceae bacterium]|nr:M28 family peptidase [Gemmataceae bacterium]